MDLTRYLIGEAVQTHQDRMASLRQFYPTANAKDWQLKNAGKRVQIIKKCDEKGGKLEFGTEIVALKMAVSRPYLAPRLVHQSR